MHGTVIARTRTRVFHAHDQQLPSTASDRAPHRGISDELVETTADRSDDPEAPRTRPQRAAGSEARAHPGASRRKRMGVGSARRVVAVDQHAVWLQKAPLLARDLGFHPLLIASAGGRLPELGRPQEAAVLHTV